MAHRHQLGRRSFLATSAALAATLAYSRRAHAEAKPIGFIYVGPRLDYGYNYSMDQGRQFVESTPSTQLPAGRSWRLDLTFPIYTGGLQNSRVQQTVYQHRAATEALERIARQTERQTRDAYLGVISEISRVRALRQAVESNRTALRAPEAGFEVGTQTTVDVLASQNNLRRQETTYSRSRYDYMINVLRLKQAAGQLSEADIEQVDGWLQQ